MALPSKQLCEKKELNDNLFSGQMILLLPVKTTNYQDKYC